jgi:hypothetical protein
MAYVGRSDCYDGQIEAVSETLQEAQWTADVIAELTNKYQLTIREVVEMAGLAMEVINRGREELESYCVQARRDCDRLAAPVVPIEEVLEIWERNQRMVRALAEGMEYGPRRTQIEDFLEQAEAQMKRTLDRTLARARERGLI